MATGIEGADGAKNRDGPRRRYADFEGKRRADWSFPKGKRVVITTSSHPEYVSQAGVVVRIGEHNPAVRFVQLDSRPDLPPLQCLISQLEAEAKPKT
jgi:hypothetical protein